MMVVAGDDGSTFALPAYVVPNNQQL